MSKYKNRKNQGLRVRGNARKISRSLPSHRPPTTVTVRLENGRMVVSMENPPNEWVLSYLQRLGEVGKK